MKRHWHVVENTSGYMPESEPITCMTRKKVNKVRRYLVDSLKEEGYRVVSSGTDLVRLERGFNDLGRVVDVIECDDNCEVTA